MVRRAKKPINLYRLISSILFLIIISAAFLLLRVSQSDSMRYIFLITNIMLAAIPLLLAWWLVRRIKVHGWLEWKQLLITALWFVFLPNSFYIITDFVHLRLTYEASYFYDIIMVTSFALAGVLFGFMSLFLVHQQLNKRLGEQKSWGIVLFVLLASSFAITLGRFTRWNTWDIVLKPAGLLFDVSDRLINPAAHSETYLVTLAFFIMLSAVYWVVWESVRAVRQTN